MASTTVSVCMPAYNAEKYILESVLSVLNQTYQNLELIVINDGSKDKTGDILQSISDPRLRVFSQPNKGQCAAANAAFLHATGDYIKFFDADDLVNPEFIEEQVQLMNGKTNVVVSAAWGRFYNDDFATFSLNRESVWRTMTPVDWLVESLWNGPNMMQCGLWLIPRNVLQKSGLWDERLSLINDFDFIIRVLLSAEEVIFSEKSVLYYRSGIRNSLSGTKSRTAMESAFLSVQLGCDSLLKAENSERTRKVCADTWQLWAYNFYPEYPDLTQQAETMVKTLGGSKYKFPAGRAAQILSGIVGWKQVKRMKRLSEKRS